MNLFAELQYFSPLSVFKYSIGATNIFFDIYDISPKMSFRNRCIIAGANGLLNLSVPIEGGRDRKHVLKDIRIANDSKWQTDHWRTITSAYNRSPYFEFYKEQLELLFQKEFKFLVDWNLALFEWTTHALHIEAKIHFIDDPVKMSEVNIDRDIRNLWKPGNFQDESENISIRYRQVFEDRIGFQPNLSIIDLIFCVGKDARRILT